MDITTFKTAISTLIKACDATTNLFWERQNIARPTAAHYSLFVPTLEPGQNITRQGFNADGLVTTNALLCTVYIAYYGAGAVTKLTNLCNRLRKGSTSIYLHANNMAIDRIEKVLDTTDVYNSQFEESASMDVFIRTIDTLVNTDITYIEHVEVSGTIENKDSSTQTIPPAISDEIVVES